MEFSVRTSTLLKLLAFTVCSFHASGLEGKSYFSNFFGQDEIVVAENLFDSFEGSFSYSYSYSINLNDGNSSSSDDTSSSSDHMNSSSDDTSSSSDDPSSSSDHMSSSSDDISSSSDDPSSSSDDSFIANQPSGSPVVSTNQPTNIPLHSWSPTLTPTASPFHSCGFPTEPCSKKADCCSGKCKPVKGGRGAKECR